MKFFYQKSFVSVLLAVVYFSFVLFGRCETVGGMPAVELYKKYVESPPFIQSAIFKEHISGLADSYYFVRWQTNAMFVGKSFSPILNDVKSDFEEWTGKYDNQYWFKAFNGYYTWTDKNNPKDADNTVKLNYEVYAKSSLAVILNWGCNIVLPLAIKWQENKFSLTNSNTVLIGDLTTNSIGKLAGLKVSRLKLRDNGTEDKQLPPWSYEFAYQNPLSLEYLPDHIKATYIEDNGNKIQFDYEIIEINVTNNSMPPELFYVSPSTNLVQISITNGYRQYAAGRKELELARAREHMGKTRAVFFSIIALLFLGMIFFLRQNHKKQQ